MRLIPVLLGLTTVLSAAAASDIGAQPKPPSISAIKTPVIKQGTLTSGDIDAILAELKGMNPASFNVVVSQPGKPSVRLGNAAIKDLSTVNVFSAPGARPSAANEIVTSVDNYIKVVWTSNVTGADKARMDRVNALLAKGTP